MEKSKRKKFSSIIVATTMMLGILGACKPISGPDPSAPPETVLTAQELAGLVLPYSGCEAPEAVEYLNTAEDREQLGSYIEKAHALSGWADGAIIRATGASAFELAVIRMADEDAARGGEDSLKDYLYSREGDFTGYAPEQADMVANGVVSHSGVWLGLFICPNPEGARVAFEAALKGETLPPPPTPSPEPELEEDMLPLMVDLIRFCKEEIDTLGGYSYISSTGASEDYFIQIMEENYGVNTAQVESGFCVNGHSPDFSDRAFEFTVLRMTGEDEAVQSTGGFRRYLQDREAVFTEMELPEEAELADNGLAVQTGRYLALFVCQHPEEAKAEFEDALLRLRPTQLAKSPQKVDMERLRERLEAVCQEEIDAVREQGRQIFHALDVSNVFTGIDFNQAESSLWFGGETKADPFQIAVVYMKDERAAASLAAEFQLHLWNEEYQYLQNGLPGQAQQISDGSIVQLGRYVALLVCRSPQAVEAELESALRDLSSVVKPSVGPSVPPGTLEQPIFVELDNPMPEGEADPNYPDRIKFVQPNEEDMSLYDTSAILAAWEKGNSAGLSDDDRAIYDAAQTVLEEVLHDGMSPFETEAALYDWLVRNVDYCWDHTELPKEANRATYTPYGGLVKREAICLGYASSFQLLMEMAGMECLTVVGASHASMVDHAWNMVRLNGQWYCADATWDYAYRETMNGCEWRYFNVTSDYMARTDHQWDYTNIPEASAENHGQSARSK